MALTVGESPTVEPSSVRVNFAVIGAFKAGTTALYRFLEQHPDVLVPDEKEPHFFDSELTFPPWGPMEDLYHSFFKGYTGERAIGDTTPTYMYSRDAMQRMRTYDPEMKLIVVLRNPVERAYSHFQMMRALSEQEGPGWWATERHSSFGVALAVEARRLRKDPRRDFPSAYFVHSYLGRGLYSSALENVLAFFPREQLCVIRSDHLRDRHRQTMTEVFSFLGVDPDVIPPAAIVHAKQYPDMPLAYRRFLSWRYAREIKRLEELLGWDLEEWRT